MLSPLSHINIIIFSIKGALSLFTLLSSPKIKSLSSLVSGVVSVNNIVLPSLSSRYLPLNPSSPHWLVNLLLPRSVPLFQYLSSFTQETDIARNYLVQGYLINNEASILPLVGVIASE